MARLNLSAGNANNKLLHTLDPETHPINVAVMTAAAEAAAGVAVPTEVAVGGENPILKINRSATGAATSRRLLHSLAMLRWTPRSTPGSEGPCRSGNA